MSLYRNLADLILDKDNYKGITFIAGEYDEVFVSYKDLCTEALEVLYNLQNKGICRGSELVFQVQDNREFVCCFWACILGGIIPVPVAVGNNGEHRHKLFKIWETLKSPYLITDNKGVRVLQKSIDDGINADKIKKVVEKTVLTEEIRDLKGTGVIYESAPEDIAFIQFSSGSTGDPKGVILTHHNLLTNLDAIISGARTSEKDSALSWMPLTHDMGLIGFHMTPVAADMNQYIMPTSLFIRNPVLWMKKAHEHKVTVLSSPNFGYKYFLQFYKPESSKGWDLSNVRLIFNGAEPISVELCKTFLKDMFIHGLKPNVMFNVYGMAEASLAVTFPPPGEELSSIKLDREFMFTGDRIREDDKGDDTRSMEFADLGYAVPDCFVRICDDEGKVLGEKTIGNIEIKGGNVTSGYYNNSEATLRTINKDGWLNTGDLGFIRNGRLVVTGRAKDVIFVNGQNYYAHDVERVSEGVEGVELGKVAACSVFNNALQKDDIILLILFKKKLDSFVELAVNLKKHIYKQMGLEIANVIPVKSIPKTTSGKIQRYKLGEMYKNSEFDPVIKELEGLLNEYEANKVTDNPQNDTEERLARILSEVLGIGRIGVNDNLFELGGDSLKASILVSKIQKDFNVEIPIEELFECGTVRGIAEYIETAEVKEYSPVEPVGERPFYAVTPAQKRLLALDRIEGSGISYNIPVVMTIEGGLEVHKLEEAFKALVLRHETLRTSFEVVDGQPVQKVHKHVDFNVEIEYETAGIDQKEDSIDDRINSLVKRFIKPFDLTKAPLMRVRLVKLSEGRHILLLDIHHIISDGTSMGILVREFTRLYRGESLDELRVQYKDYAQWKNDMFKADAMKKQEGYWLNRLSGEIPLLSLPLDNPRPAIRSFSGDNIIFSVDRGLKEKLKKLGIERGVSLFMMLMAAYNVLLSKYSGQEDIIVGSPAAGRGHPDAENVVGMFVNTLPLRNFPAGNKTFSYFLEEVRKDTLKAYESQDYQFDQLVEKLDVRRDMSRNPLFDTMLVLQNMEIPEFEIEGLKFINYHIKNKSAKFDITLEAEENQEGISFNLEYCTRLFKREAMERMAGHFENILKVVVENPDKEISKIDMLTEEEKSQILFEFNNTKSQYPKDKTITCVFEEQVEKMPDDIAVIFEDKTLTYKELNNRANSLARVLREQGVKADSIAAIMLERSLEMIVGILAVLKAGGAYLPISPDYPEERIRYILEDSGAKILLTKNEVLRRYSEEARDSFEVAVMDLDYGYLYSVDRSNLDKLNNSNLEKFNNSNLERVNTSRNLAYVIYTSGSTGKPKGAMIEHYSVINRINWMQKNYPIGKEDVILQKTPYTFDVSVWELFWWFFAGAKVCFLTPGGEKDPGVITGAIEKNGVTTMHFVPSMLNMFLEYMENGTALDRVSSLRQVFASGEALGVKQVQRFNIQAGSRYDTKLINLYGPTEATVDVSYFDCPQGQDIELVPIGKPIDNISLYIVDRYNNLQPVGIPGELCIAGDGLARGYLNRPELTAEKFVPNPFVESVNDGHMISETQRLMYRTGDLARWLPDGNIEYLGRIDHQVKVRGFRIELGEIEEELLKHESIKEAVVTARKDREDSSYLSAYMVSERDVTPGELREHLTKNLPEYMVPSYFIRLEKMPLSPNGKVDRKALPEPETNINTGVEYVEPLSREENKLARVWGEVLGVSRVGINDDFFELGGDSIKAIQVVSLLAREGIDIEVKDILVYRTVSQILLNVDYKNSSKKYGQGLIEGSFGFTPVAQWFFSKEFNNPGYFNQSVLLELKKEIDITNLKNAFAKIIEHHDGLRVNYSPDSKELYFNNRDIYKEFIIEIFDIAGLTPKEQEKELESIGVRLKSGFDITDGLLIKAAVIDTGADDRKLLITIHHLVVDGVSWRIILEDLYTTYTAIENDKEIIMPKKTASLKEWHERLQTLKDSTKVMEEKEFWKSCDDTEFELPMDFQTQDWSIAARAAVKGCLREDETIKILKEANKAYNTSVEDLLLTALGKTVKEWTGFSEMVIEMENHGRSVDSIDVSRTVGWFTAMYPLRLEITQDDTGEQIRRIKERIREVPQNGIGYGILKYLIEDMPLSAARLPELRFNYLGRFDKEADNDIFTYSHLYTGNETCPTNTMTAKLEINCMVVNDVFQFEIYFNKKAYKEETVLGLKDKYIKNLRDTICYTITSDDVYFTPSDFETLDINQEDLDMLFD